VDNKEALFLQMIRQNKGILFKVCKIYQDDPEDQNDLLQEITLQLWLVFDSFRGDSKISSWMYRVSLNTAIAYFKKQKRRPDQVLLTYDFDHPQETSTIGEKEEHLAVFYKAIKQLNKVEKALVFMYMENRPYEEIATSIGITQGNLRVRMTRIKNKLKDITKNTSYEY
jgi:RNA polymerase sigma factor (sigma-70 family)